MIGIYDFNCATIIPPINDLIQKHAARNEKIKAYSIHLPCLVLCLVLLTWNFILDNIFSKKFLDLTRQGVIATF
jgi:hypothetical protein